MFLQTLLSEGSAQDALRTSLARAARVGLEPVVVIVEPYEAVGAALDQTRAGDTLFVVHSDAEHVLGWLAIHGPDVGAASDAPEVVDHADLRTMPIRVLTQTYSAGAQEVRLRPGQLLRIPVIRNAHVGVSGTWRGRQH
jgi:hypothetical protein